MSRPQQQDTGLVYQGVHILSGAQVQWRRESLGDRPHHRLKNRSTTTRVPTWPLRASQAEPFRTDERERAAARIEASRLSAADNVVYRVGPSLKEWAPKPANVITPVRNSLANTALDFSDFGNGKVVAVACSEREVVLLLADGRLDISLDEEWVEDTEAPRLSRLGFGRKKKTEPKEAGLTGLVQIEFSVAPLRTAKAEWFFDKSRKIGPAVVERFPRWACISQVACGAQHTACITDLASGRMLYTWGSNAKGQLGLGAEVGEVKVPTRVAGMSLVSAVGCGARYTVAAARNDQGSTIVYSWGVRSKTKKIASRVDEEIFSSGLGFLPHEFEGAPTTHAFEPQACVALWPGQQYRVGRPIKYWPPTMDAWLQETVNHWWASNRHTNLEVDDLDSFQISSLLRDRNDATARQVALSQALARDVEREFGVGAEAGPDSELALFELDRTLQTLAGEISALEENGDGDAGGLEALEVSSEFFRSCRFLFDGSDLPRQRLDFDQVALEALHEDALQADLDLIARKADDSLCSIIARSSQMLDNVASGLRLCKDCDFKAEISALVERQRTINQKIIEGVRT